MSHFLHPETTFYCLAVMINNERLNTLVSLVIIKSYLNAVNFKAHENKVAWLGNLEDFWISPTERTEIVQVGGKSLRANFLFSPFPKGITDPTTSWECRLRIGGLDGRSCLAAAWGHCVNSAPKCKGDYHSLTHSLNLWGKEATLGY